MYDFAGESCRTTVVVRRSRMATLNFVRHSVGCISVDIESKNSPGSRSLVSLTSSAGLQPMSSLGVVRRLNITRGKLSIQSVVHKRTFRASFIRRWKRSTSPLDCGWYEVTLFDCLTNCSILTIYLTRVDFLCQVLQTEIPSATTALLRTRAVESDMGMASGQWVKRSKHVSK